MRRTKVDGFPFLPGDIVFIEMPSVAWESVLPPICIRGDNEFYVFENYELGREGLTLYIRDGLWRYNFGALSDCKYFFSGSYMDKSDIDDPFRPHLHATDYLWYKTQGGD